MEEAVGEREGMPQRVEIQNDLTFALVNSQHFCLPDQDQ